MTYYEKFLKLYPRIAKKKATMDILKKELRKDDPDFREYIEKHSCPEYYFDSDLAAEVDCVEMNCRDCWDREYMDEELKYEFRKKEEV